MRLPVPITFTAYFVLCIIYGAVGFAVAGAISGFFSFLHWLSGAALMASIIYLAPKLFIVVSGDEGGE